MSEREPAYWIDWCHGMVGGPAVIGPTGVRGFMQGFENDAKATEMCARLNAAWAELGPTVEHLQKVRDTAESQIASLQSQLDALKSEMSTEINMRKIEHGLAENAQAQLAEAKAALAENDVPRLRDCEQAWEAVFAALTDAVPDIYKLAPSGHEMALAAIRKLSLAEHKGASEMLGRIQQALQTWPDGGCDIGVARAVERIIASALAQAESQLAAERARHATCEPPIERPNKEPLRLGEIRDLLLATKTCDEFCDVLDAEFLGAWAFMLAEMRPSERHWLSKDIRGLCWALVAAEKSRADALQVEIDEAIKVYEHVFPDRPWDAGPVRQRLTMLLTSLRTRADAAEVDVARLRKQNHDAASEREKRCATEHAELANLRNLMSEAWKYHADDMARQGKPVWSSISAYGQGAAALLISERDDARAELEVLKQLPLKEPK